MVFWRRNGINELIQFFYQNVVMKKRRYCRNDDPANRLKVLQNPPVFHDANLGKVMTTIWQWR